MYTIRCIIASQFYMILTEFRANGNWRGSSVHPGLSLYKLQPYDSHTNKHSMHTASKIHHAY